MLLRLVLLLRSIETVETTGEGEGERGEGESGRAGEEIQEDSVRK